MRRMLGCWLALTALIAVPSDAVAAPGTAVARGLNHPVDAVRDSSGGVLVADAGDHRIKRIAPNGTVTTVAGTGVAGFSGDGGAATAAQLNGPRSVAAVPGGGFLVADGENWRVRRVTPDGRISTVAGGGVMGWRCPADMLWNGETRAVTPTADGGFVYVAQGGIFAVSPTGATRFLATSGDVQDIDTSWDGSLLLAGGRANVVYRLAPDGSSVTVAAGTGEPGAADGQANRATFDDVRGVAGFRGDIEGGAFTADYDTGLVRRVGTFVDRWAGHGNGPGPDVDLTAPTGVSVEPGGNLLVADPSAHTVWRVDGAAGWAPAAKLATTAPPNSPDACRALDRSFGHGGLAPSNTDWSVFRTYLPSETGFDVDAQGRAASTVLTTRGDSIGLAVRRIRADGSPDTSFGQNGVAFAPLTPAADGVPPMTPMGLLRLADGRYVAAAVFNRHTPNVNRLVVAAFTATGALDTSFGAGGIVAVLEDTGLHGGGMLLPGPNGTFTVVGHEQERWRLVRLDGRGRRVTSFGDGGVKTFPDSANIGGGQGAGIALPDGRMVITGPWGRIVRLLPDGSPDPAWGDDNALAFAPGDGSGLEIHGVTAQADGRLLVVGQRSYPSGPYAARLLSDGRPDPSFGTGGIATLPDGVNALRDIVVRADGRLLAAGHGINSSGYGPALFGMLPDGRPDGAVGDGGLIVTPMGSNGLHDHVRILPGGKALTDGQLDWEIDTGHVFARYDIGGSGPAAPGPPDDGEGDGDGDPPSNEEPGRGSADDKQPGAGEPTASAPPAPAADSAEPPRTRASTSPTRRLTVPARIARATLLTRGLPFTFHPARSGRAVVRLTAGGRVVARSTTRLRAGAQHRIRLLVRRRAWPRRAPKTIRLTIDAGGRRIASATIRLR